MLTLVSLLCWSLGIALTLLYHQSINDTSHSAYRAMLVGIALTLPVGLLLSVLKILAAATVVLKCSHNRCLRITLVDEYTLMITKSGRRVQLGEEVGEEVVKEKRKKYRQDVP